MDPAVATVFTRMAFFTFHKEQKGAVLGFFLCEKNRFLHNSSVFLRVNLKYLQHGLSCNGEVTSLF